MNTENNQEDNSITTIGQQLRSAREQMGLDMKDVADQLCLKITMIKDIENDLCPPELALTFFRGYIRSYAKLVNLPEEELLSQVSTAHNSPKNKRELKFSTGKRTILAKSNRKHDFWIMPFTWLILLVLVCMSGLWWWQNYHNEQEKFKDLPIISGQSSAITHNAQGEITTAIPLTNSIPMTINGNSPQSAQPVITNDNSTGLLAVSALLQQKLAAPPTLTAKLTAEAQKQQDILFNTVYMTFSKDCWLNVVDANKTRLFSGMKRSGSKLEFSGKPPYQVRLGDPTGVNITFRGKSIAPSKNKNSVLLIEA